MQGTQGGTAIGAANVGAERGANGESDRGTDFDEPAFDGTYWKAVFTPDRSAHRPIGSPDLRAVAASDGAGMERNALSPDGSVR